MLFFMSLDRISRLGDNRVVAPIQGWFVESLEELVRAAWRPW